MHTWEFHRVAQSCRSLCWGMSSCFWAWSNWDVASGLLRKWPTIARAFARSLGNSVTSRLDSPAFTQSCNVWAKHGRQVTVSMCVIAFFMLAPLSVTINNSFSRRDQSSKTVEISFSRKSAVWLPGAGLTVRQWLSTLKLSSSQCAVTPRYESLLDNVHMSAVNEQDFTALNFVCMSLLTSVNLFGINLAETTCRVGSV